MAYKSLYRAYRPQVFEDVSGQEAIITTLKHAIEENRIAHAYLFCGPRGTGKTTVAKLFAKAVNCLNDNKPCGECENCKAIENSSHPDVIEIDAASNNGVEEVRHLIDKVKYAPVSGKYKVYIIDEVHMMSTGAFNALLKTLEEPPAHVIFILATTEPHKILPTIISRCQRFDFTSLTEQELIDRMKIVLLEENKTYEDSAIIQIAKLANGGMRDALSILEQCLAYNDQHLSLKDVNAIYGIVSMEDKIRLIKMILSGDMENALKSLDKMDHNGIDIKRLTYDLIDILKDTVIYKNTNNTQILSVMNQEDIKQIVPYITSDEALSFIDILIHATEKYVKAVNPHIYFELSVLKMCNHDHQEAQVIKNKDVQKEKDEEIQFIEEDTEEPPIIDIEEDKNDIEEYNDSDIQVKEEELLNILVQADRHILNDVKEKWIIIKRYMSNLKTAKCAHMLSAGTPVAACKDAIIISFEFMPDVNAVNYYKNYKQIASLIKEIFNIGYRFVGIQNDDWKNLRNKYIQLMKTKNLPVASPIIFSHIDQYDLEEENKTEAEKYAIDLFGEDIVEFTEE